MDAEDVYVDVAKVRDYLLSSTHPVGRFKASFFFRLGYLPEEWQILAADLRAIPAAGVTSRTISGRHGVKHIVSGTLTGPNGVVAEVTTVWIVRHGDTVLRLVTAYPGAEG